MFSFLFPTSSFENLPNATECCIQINDNVKHVDRDIKNIYFNSTMLCFFFSIIIVVFTKNKSFLFKNTRIFYLNLILLKRSF